MKRITLQISKDFVAKVGFKSLIKYVKKVELQKIYWYDDKTLWAIQKFEFHSPEFTPAALQGIDGIGIKYIEELKKEDEKTYICLVKTEKETQFHEILSEFNIILDYPLIITEDYIKISLISDESILKRLPKYLSKKDYEILSISNPTHDISEKVQIQLTNKQQEVIQYAVDRGFFEIPRNIKSKAIADNFKITVSAFNELLRRVERKLFKTYFNK